MAELLGLLLEIFGEVIVEIVVALISRALRAMFNIGVIESPIFAVVGYAMFGSVAGAISLVAYPHPLIRPSKLHGISLIVTPAVTGSVMSLIGLTLRRQGKQTTRIESFTYGFAFAFGMAL